MIDEAEKEAAIERLARELNFKMEHLDPTSDPLWDEGLSERDKEFYRLCVKWLLLERDDVLVALGLPTTS